MTILEIEDDSFDHDDDDKVEAVSDLVLPGGEKVEEGDDGSLELCPPPGVHCGGAGRKGIGGRGVIDRNIDKDRRQQVINMSSHSRSKSLIVEVITLHRIKSGGLLLFST